MGVNLATFAATSSGPASRAPSKFALGRGSAGLGLSALPDFWLGLPNLAKLVGGGWLLFGLVYCACRTGGFRASATPFRLQRRHLSQPITCHRRISRLS